MLDYAPVRSCTMACRAIASDKSEEAHEEKAGITGSGVKKTILFHGEESEGLRVTHKGQSMMLWRSDGAPHVQILGSIHYLDEAAPDWVIQVHEAAHVVVFEADFRQAKDLPPPTLPPDLSLPALDLELWQVVEGTAMATSFANEVPKLGRQR
jgi:hypothetical protein